MKQEDIIKVMQDLSLCKITPDDWKVYWEKYDKEFEKELNRMEYLDIKIDIVTGKQIGRAHV